MVGKTSLNVAHMTTGKTARKFERPGIRGYLHEPAAASTAAMALTHGAGGNCDAPLLIAVADAFAEAGYLVLRYDLPFRQLRPKGSPSSAQKRDRDGIHQVADTLRELAPAARVILAGHSYGGRQSTMLAAEDSSVAQGLLLLSYPLHAPGHPEKSRTEHFPALRCPALFVHGTRDDFGSIDEMTAAIALIPTRTRLMRIEGGKHGLPPTIAPSLPPELSSVLA